MLRELPEETVGEGRDADAGFEDGGDAAAPLELGAVVEVSADAEEAVGGAAAEVEVPAATAFGFTAASGEVAAAAARGPGFGDEPMARVAMRPATKRIAAATDTGSHRLPGCVTGCVAFTLRPFEESDNSRS